MDFGALQTRGFQFVEIKNVLKRNFPIAVFISVLQMTENESDLFLPRFDNVDLVFIKLSLSSEAIISWK